MKKETIAGNQLDVGFQFLFMRITSIVFDWAVASSLSIYDFTRLYINSIVKPHHPFKAGPSDIQKKGLFQNEVAAQAGHRARQQFSESLILKNF